MHYFTWLRQNYGVASVDETFNRTEDAIRHDFMQCQGTQAICWIILGILPFSPKQKGSRFTTAARLFAKLYVRRWAPMHMTPKAEDDVFQFHENQKEYFGFESNYRVDIMNSNSNDGMEFEEEEEEMEGIAEHEQEEKPATTSRLVPVETVAEQPEDPEVNLLPKHLDPRYLHEDNMKPLIVLVDHFMVNCQDERDQIKSRLNFAMAFYDESSVHFLELFLDETGEHNYVNFVRKLWSETLDWVFFTAEKMLGEDKYAEGKVLIINLKGFMDCYRTIDVLGHSVKEAKMIALLEKFEHHMHFECMAREIRQSRYYTEEQNRTRAERFRSEIEITVANLGAKYPEIAIHARSVSGLLMADLYEDPEAAKKELKQSLKEAQRRGLNQRSSWLTKLREWIKHFCSTVEEREEEIDPAEVARRINQIEEQSKGLSVIRFMIYACNEYPPVHMKSFDTKNMSKQLLDTDTREKAMRDLIRWYHPDKVDTRVHGKAHKEICEAITKQFNASMQGWKKSN